MVFSMPPTAVAFSWLIIIVNFSFIENSNLFPDATKNETEEVVGFPKAVQFLGNYKDKPLIMKQAALFTISSFPDVAISELPNAFTVFVKPQGSKESMSLRKFFRIYGQDKLSLNQQIPVVVKSQIPLPSCLNCEALTDDNLLFTNIILRRGKWTDDLKLWGKSKASLNCLLDGEVSLVMFSANGLKIKLNSAIEETEVSKQVRSFHEVNLKAGDCLHIPSNWLVKLSSNFRTVFISIVYDSTKLKINEKSCEQPSQEMTIDGLNFKDEEQENLFTVISLANLALFIETYVQRANMTRSNFYNSLQKDPKLKGIKKWNEECESSANELFAGMDVDRDGILSVSDFDSIDEEGAMYLGGILDDKMGDLKEIIEDQSAEIKMEPNVIAGTAKQIKSTYEKELQEVLEEGFNELLREANMEGSLKFGENGEPLITLNEKSKDEEVEKEMSIKEEVEEINDAIDEQPTIKEEL